MGTDMGTPGTLGLEDLDLESGESMPTAEVHYRVHGPASGAEATVLLPTYYTGTDASYAPWIGPGRALDPTRHRIVVVNHLGGGVSTSPSTTGGPFPHVSIGDLAGVAWLVLESLGIEHVDLAAGWSLGGMQALELAAQRPGDVATVLAVCSAARCSAINRVFLESVAAVLRVDSELGVGPAARGLDAFGRVYAGWAYSEEFFEDGHFTELGYSSITDVLESWGADHVQHDALDLLASLRTWLAADVALGSVRARTVLMPSSTDRYFTPAENEKEVAALSHGALWTLVSPLGHVAGRPGVRRQEQALVDEALRALLDPSTRTSTQPKENMT
ncbi:alpha/beta fold hydrolase [Aeromicrobium halocynthiae]|uniref:Alpha/beta fold hydrolase n=1 Tax=Aeromicrobium halocynthiae TaxID=560557 RepID=A0ABP5H9L4_9ACTN